MIKSPVSVGEWMFPPTWNKMDCWEHFISISIISFIGFFTGHTEKDKRPDGLSLLSQLMQYFPHCDLRAGFLQNTQELNHCVATHQKTQNNIKKTAHIYRTSLERFFLSKQIIIPCRIDAVFLACNRHVSAHCTGCIMKTHASLDGLMFPISARQLLSHNQTN